MHRRFGNTRGIIKIGVIHENMVSDRSLLAVLHWLNLHVISVCVAASGAICLIVTIYYLFRAFRQMDEVVEAAGKLVHQPEQPLRLSRSLQGVQMS